MKRKWSSHIIAVMTLVVFVLLALGSGASSPSIVHQEPVGPRTDEEWAEEYRKRGWYSFANRDYTSALANINMAIELDPNNADCYYNRGRVYYAQKNNDAALNDYKKALEIDPQGSNTCAFLGELYYDAGDYDTALKYYNRSISIRANNDVAINGIKKIEEARAAEARRIAREEANRYDPAKFTIVPSDFAPADYTSIDLFAAVADVEKGGTYYGNSYVFIPREYVSVSVVVFVSQNGTDTRFRTTDNAISQNMKVDGRSGLTSGQRVRLYYRVAKNPLAEWRVVAIERL